MGLVTFIAPIRAGKLDEWRHFSLELSGAKKKDWEDFNNRMHLRAHRAWHQTLPNGEYVIVQLEGDGAKEMMAHVAASKIPFDIWFRKEVEDIHGFDLSKPPSPPAQLLIDNTL